jgi:hypothetical protein
MQVAAATKPLSCPAAMVGRGFYSSWKLLQRQLTPHKGAKGVSPGGNMETNNKTKNVVVIGEKDSQLEIMDFFDTPEEASTYIGIESMQFESEGVVYHAYRKVEE